MHVAVARTGTCVYACVLITTTKPTSRSCPAVLARWRLGFRKQPDFEPSDALLLIFGEGSLASSGI